MSNRISVLESAQGLALDARVDFGCDRDPHFRALSSMDSDDGRSMEFPNMEFFYNYRSKFDELAGLGLFPGRGGYPDHFVTLSGRPYCK